MTPEKKVEEEEKKREQRSLGKNSSRLRAIYFLAALGALGSPKY